MSNLIRIVNNVPVTSVSKVTVDILPVFKSFKRCLNKCGIEIETSDTYLKLFNNKNSVLFSNRGSMPSDREFSQAVNILKTSITYYTQTWLQWVNVNRTVIQRDGERKNGNYRDLIYNVIIYCVLVTDENENIPFACICDVMDYDNFDEIEGSVESLIDTVIDLYCTSVCQDWFIAAVVPIQSLNLLK